MGNLKLIKINENAQFFFSSSDKISSFSYCFPVFFFFLVACNPQFVSNLVTVMFKAICIEL